MSDPNAESALFGCPACRTVPELQSELRLARVRMLFMDSHEGYSLHACQECRQPFLEQFQEITWLPNGDDHIWVRWMPITEPEFAAINQFCPGETEDGDIARQFAKMMHTRGRLVRDPNDRFAWYDSPYDAGNLYPPG